jgi:hypothetical protein
MRRRHSARGAELIEMAFVLPILLLVVAGIIDFGFLFQRFVVVTNAAREGARVAVLPGYLPSTAPGALACPDIVANHMRDYIRQGVGDATLNPTCAMTIVNVGGTPSMRVVEVVSTIRYDYLILGPIAGLVGGDFDNVNVTGRARMRIEVAI